jgi:hypothetical protein
MPSTARRGARRAHARVVTDQFKMLTARAMIMTATTSEMADWASISIFYHRVIGGVSVGLNAVALVKAT